MAHLVFLSSRFAIRLLARNILQAHTQKALRFHPPKAMSLKCFNAFPLERQFRWRSIQQTPDAQFWIQATQRRGVYCAVLVPLPLRPALQSSLPQWFFQKAPNMTFMNDWMNKLPNSKFELECKIVGKFFINCAVERSVLIKP